MLSSDFVPTSPCLVDPWIRPFTIGIAPVFRTPRSVWIRKTESLPRARHPAEPSKTTSEGSPDAAALKKSLFSHSAVLTGLSWHFYSRASPSRKRVAENCWRFSHANDCTVLSNHRTHFQGKLSQPASPAQPRSSPAGR